MTQRITTIDGLLHSEQPEAKFAAIQVATALAHRARGPVPADSAAALAQLPAGAGGQALPEAEAVQLSRTAIRIAAADPALAPLLRAAIEQNAASDKQLGTGILEAGVVLTLAMFVAKCRIERDAGGHWIFKHEPIGDPALIEVAKAIQEVAKAASKILALIPGSGD